jgi:hypothetical protein
MTLRAHNAGAPPVYRPVASGRVAMPVQLKAIATRGSQVKAPAAYRPQQALQPKRCTGLAGPGKGAPPVYRPQASQQILLKRTTAPPVYKPTVAPIAAQPKPMPGAIRTVQSKPQSVRTKPPLARPLTRGVVQPKFGFELEVPVTFLTDKLKSVGGKQAYLNGPYFKVVGDGSSQAGQMKGMVDDEEVFYSPTILEIVTHPIDEHADDAEVKVAEILGAIELFRFRLYLATNGFTKTATLKELAGDDLNLVLNGTEDYIINHPTATPRKASPETAYIHLTVGVSLGALQRAGEWVRNRAVSSYPGNDTHKDAINLMLYSDLFSYTLMNTPSSKQVWDEVDNFIYLAYSHVRAIDRHGNSGTRVKGGGTKKNYTPYLSRTPFHQIFKSLHSDTQKYLIKHKDGLKKILADNMHQGDEVVLKAQEYLTAIFDQTVKPQQAYFGGMVERGIERTGKDGSGLVGPPVEIRPMGTALSEKQVRKVVAEVFDASRDQFTNTKAGTPLKMMTELALA